MSEHGVPSGISPNLVLSAVAPAFKLHFTSHWPWARKKIIEPRHDKTNKMSVSPAKTQIRLGIHPIWSVFAVRMKKAWVLSYPLSAQLRLWSDWVDAQVDLSLRWAHSHFVGFVMPRLKKVTQWATTQHGQTYFQQARARSSKDASRIWPNYKLNTQDGLFRHSRTSNA